VATGRQLGIAGLLLALVCASLTAQEKNQSGNNARKKFGASLKRLKWDSKKGAAVEKPEQRKNDKSDVLELRALLVVFDVLVTDKASRPVSGLRKEDFTVSEDGKPQQVATFLEGTDSTLPRSIVLIVDYSGSQAGFIDSSIEAAKNLIYRLPAADEMAIVTDDVELVCDFTGDKAKLSGALDSVGSRARRSRRDEGFFLPNPERGRDLQFSALFAALRELAGRDGRRSIIIFQTDGTEAPTFRDQPTEQDYRWNMPARQYGLRDVYAAAERSRATIYSVIPGEPLMGLPPVELYARGRSAVEAVVRSRFESDVEYRVYSRGHPLSDAQVKLFTDRYVQSQAAVAHVAESTGGWAVFLERPAQADEIYRRILADVNQRYVVGYYPENSARDGGFRRVRIQVRGHPEYAVHGRTGYYAPSE
jgi:VWFA-related protein